MRQMHPEVDQKLSAFFAVPSKECVLSEAMNLQRFLPILRVLLLLLLFLFLLKLYNFPAGYGGKLAIPPVMVIVIVALKEGIPSSW